MDNYTVTFDRINVTKIQNPDVKMIYEFPNENAANKFREWLKDNSKYKNTIDIIRRAHAGLHLLRLSGCCPEEQGHRERHLEDTGRSEEIPLQHDAVHAGTLLLYEITGPVRRRRLHVRPAKHLLLVPR